MKSTVLSRKGRQAAPVRRLVTVALLILCLLPYVQTLHYPFHFDDTSVIRDNLGLACAPWSWSGIAAAISLSPPGIKGRPVAQISFLLNRWLLGDEPFSYRLVNLIIHLVNVCLLYLLALRLYRALGMEGDPPMAWMALYAALVWGLHPVQSQAVTYLVQRVTSLMTAFSLAGLLCFLKGRSEMKIAVRLLWWGGGLFLSVLAMGTKQSAAVVPVLAFLLEVWLRCSSGRRVWTRGTVAAAGLLLLFVCIAWFIGLPGQRMDALIPGKGFTPYQRTISAGRVLFLYLSLLLWPLPWRFSIDRAMAASTSLLHPWTSLPALTIVLLAAGWALLKMKRYSLPALAVLWFILAQAVEIGPVPIDLVQEHRLYLATAVPSIWFSTLFFRGLGKRDHTEDVLPVGPLHKQASRKPDSQVADEE